MHLFLYHVAVSCDPWLAATGLKEHVTHSARYTTIWRWRRSCDISVAICG